MAKSIMNETNKALLTNYIDCFIAHLKASPFTEENKALALSLTSLIKNSRSLIGEDLLNLYHMINRHHLTD